MSRFSFAFDAFSQVILGEEVAASKLTIFDISKQICDAVQARAGQGLINMKDYAVMYFTVH